MSQIEIDSKNNVVRHAVLAHALDAGVRNTMIEGDLSLEGSAECGFAAVLSLKTVGEVTEKTAELRDMVLGSLRARSLVVLHDGVEVLGGEQPGSVVRRLPRLPSLKKLSRSVS